MIKWLLIAKIWAIPILLEENPCSRSQKLWKNQEKLRQPRLSLTKGRENMRRGRSWRSNGKLCSALSHQVLLGYRRYFWLGQMILKLSNGDSASYPFDDFDGRISKVESFVKATAKMLQDKIGDVDKKIESEIGAVSSELGRKIEEKSLMWQRDLNRLEVRNEDLGKSLDRLKEMGFLTKEEFESYKRELKKRRGFYGSDEDVSLDEIGALAKEIVEKEIEKHAADGLGMVDYALASGGGMVIIYSEPFVSGKASNWFGVGIGRDRVHPNVWKMLEPSFGEPGQCFALQGSSGYVDIRLRAGIIPEAVTLEHVSKSVAYDRSSAPKDCDLCMVQRVQ